MTLLPVCVLICAGAAECVMDGGVVGLGLTRGIRPHRTKNNMRNWGKGRGQIFAGFLPTVLCTTYMPYLKVAHCDSLI